MSVRIRLQRAGRKKRPVYRVVVADQRANRDGKFIERLGLYDPVPNPSVIVINEERALYWLRQGAQPSDTARSLLRKTGVWSRFKSPNPAPSDAAESDSDDDTTEESD